MANERRPDELKEPAPSVLDLIQASTTDVSLTPVAVLIPNSTKEG